MKLFKIAFMVLISVIWILAIASWWSDFGLFVQLHGLAFTNWLLIGFLINIEFTMLVAAFWTAMIVIKGS